MKRLLVATLAVAVGAGALVPLRLALAAAPSNDSPATATALTVGAEMPWSTIMSTDAGETPCDGGGAVWFTFTAPSNGDFLFYTADQTASAIMRIYGAGDDPLTDCPTEADYASDSYESVAVRSMTSGETVTIRLERWESYTSGNGWLGVVELSSAADGFSDSRQLPVPAPGQTAVIGLTLDETFGSEAGEPTECGSQTLAASSTWVDFTPQETGSWFLEVTSDVRLDSSVHRGETPGGLSTVSCAFLAKAGPGSTSTGSGHVVRLVADETVRIRVSSAGETADFVIRARRAEVRMAPEQLTTFEGADTESAEVVVVDGRPVVLYSDGPDFDLRIVERQPDGTWVDSKITDGAGIGVDKIDNFVSALVVDDELLVAFTSQAGVGPGADGQVFFGRRGGDGNWTFEMVDTSDYLIYSLDFALVDGRPAVTYYKDDALWFAQRDATGTWTAVMVDDDGAGGGESTEIGWQSVLLDIDGSPAIAYLDYSAGAIRWAERSGGSWSDSQIFSAGDEDLYVAFDGVIDQAGNPLIIAQSEYSSFTVLSRVAGTWDVEVPEHRPEVVQQAYAEYAPLQLELTRDGRPVFVWYSYDTANYWYAVTEQLPDGTWETRDAFSTEQILDPDFDGVEIDPYSIGATTLTDGRFAFAGDLSDNIWYFEDINRTCPVAAAPFTDVPASSFAVDDIDCIFGLGITTGTTGTTYSPRSFVTREQMAAFLARTYRLMTGDPCSGGSTPFTDVPASSFAVDDIGCIHGLGITTGTSSTAYSPDGLVTREQMAAFLARLYRLVTDPGCSGGSTPFTDVPASSFAVDDIGCIYGLGITTGTSSTAYSPDGLVTREQMAAFLARTWLTPAIVD